MRSRGLALITVLWVLTLLSLIAASFSSSTRTEIKLAFNQAEAARAEALADAGLHAAILGLLTGEPAREWRSDGTVYGWPFGAGEIRVRIWDEGGKIDLNGAPDALLQAVFVAVGLSPGDAAAMVDRIVDFRDNNDLRQLNGAEDSDYRAAGLPYGAKDAPFEALEELRQVLGMTPALFQAVAPALTAHARQRIPHEPTAPPLVKAALANQVLGEEEADDPADDPADEPADGAGEVEPIAPPVPGVEPDQAEAPAPTRSRLNIFTIHAEGRTNAGSVFARQAVVEIGPSEDLPFAFFVWKQGARGLFPLAAAAE